MKYLVDTHVLIWSVANSSKLSATARRLLSDVDAVYYFSPISVWEIAIKHEKHPDEMPFSGKEATELFRSAGYLELKPDARQCAAIEELPVLHGDPFDRLLIAQAKSTGLKLISHDRKVALYGDVVVVV